MQSLENRYRLPRTIEIECVAGELLPHQLRAGKRVGQSLAEGIRGGKVAATAGHHAVDLQLLEWREIHPTQALGEHRGRIALIECGSAVCPRSPDQRLRVRRVECRRAPEIRQGISCSPTTVEDLHAGTECEVRFVARWVTGLYGPAES